MSFITRQHIDACRGASNPRTLERRIHDAGLPRVPVRALKDALQRHTERYLSKPPLADPLVMQAHLRSFRLEEFKRIKQVRKAAMYPAWTVTFQQRVEQEARLGLRLASMEAEKATLEAICREARRRGWTISYASKTRDRRVSSRYIVVPGHGEVRVSDHHLPDTLARQEARAWGQRPRWNGEVIVAGDWQTVRLETWMRRIALAAAGRW